MSFELLDESLEREAYADSNDNFGNSTLQETRNESTPARRTQLAVDQKQWQETRGSGWWLEQGRKKW